MADPIKKTRSIRWRILVPLGAVTLSLAFALSLVARSQIERSLLDQAEQRVRSLAASLSAASSSVDSVAELDRFVIGLGHEEDLASIIVVDAQSRNVIATTERRLLRTSIDSIADNDLPAMLLQTRNFAQGQPYLEIGEDFANYIESIPIGHFFRDPAAPREGVAIVRFDLQRIRARVSRNSTFVFLVGLAAAFAVVAAVLWLVERRVMKPINIVAKSVRERDLASSENRFQDLGPDEFGMLAQVLKTTFDQLQDRTIEATQLARDLQFQKAALDEHAIVSETDAYGLITYVNDAFCSISKYSRDELIDQNHRILSSGYHSKEFWRRMYETVARSGTWRAEVRARAKDGSYFWVDTTIVAFRGKNNEIMRYVSIRTDITARKLAEFDLIKANLKSERSLLEAEEARKQAEEAAIAKSQFLATMSHEIRTPMNGLIGVLHLLDEELPPDKQRLLETAKNSADDLLVLINDILDFSKIEAGKMDLEEIQFDAVNLIEEIASIHSASAHEKGLELVCVCAPADNPIAHGDEHRIRQIVSNLVSNAIKFTSEGCIEIRLTNRVDDDGQRWLRFDIADSGIGIPDEAIAKLFATFSQANSSTTRKYGGTGLGLSICKRLVELMGGRIAVTSEEGKGSVFWFEIPQKNDDLRRTVSPVESKLAGSRALLIEQNDATRRQLAAWLAFWGVDCHVATSVEDAVALCEEAEPSAYDCALVDKRAIDHSPKRWEAFRSSEPRLRSARIVVLHTLAYSASHDLESQLKIDNHLHKPVRQRELALGLLGDASPNAGKTKGETNPKIRADLSRYHVLLVDDNITNRMIGSQIIKQRHQISPETAGNGHEAITALKQRDFDLVFMDCMMPEMDGYAATRAIRDGLAGDSNRNIPIIALTANAMQDDRAKCIAAGMSDYLSKPIVPENLSAVIQKWIGRCHKGWDYTDLEDAPQPPAPDTRQASCILDLQRLREVYGGDDHFVNDMLGMFIEGLQENREKLLRAAASPADFAEICFIAHRLKGVSSEFGAQRLKAHAARAETLCKAKRFEDALSLVPEIDDAIRAILDEVAAMDRGKDSA